MSTTVENINLKICYLEGPFFAVQPYFCYENETCCKEGCCRQSDYNYLGSWQFWWKFYLVLVIILIILVYNYCCWYWKKKRENTRERNVVVTYSVTDVAAEKETDPPPLYSVAIHFPKPTNQDQVPTYEQAIAGNP